MERFLKFFKARTLGYYFTLACSILALIQLIIYLVAFTDPVWESYYDVSIVIFSIVAVVSGFALTAFKQTSSWGSGLVTLFTFLSFLMFMRYGYMYFSQIFFGGIEFRLIISMYYGYLYSIIIYLIIFGLGIASCFMKHIKEK